MPLLCTTWLTSRPAHVERLQSFEFLGDIDDEQLQVKGHAPGVRPVQVKYPEKVRSAEAG